MKYFIILILVGLVAITSVNGVSGLWVPETSDELFKKSETVFIGNITSVNVLEFERSNTYNVKENGVSRIVVENYTQTLDEYTVDIEEFLKNPQTPNTITMLEATVGGVPGRSVSIGGFELGDRVLFYVPKIDGTNQYSPESFKIPKQCDAKSALERPRIEGGNSFSMIQEGVVKENNFTANKSIEFVYQKDMRSLDQNSFDFQITIRKETDDGKFDELVLSENIPVQSKICEWIATANTEFTSQVGNYQMGVHATEGTGSTTFGGNFFVEENSVSYDDVISPLKQFKSGILVDDIQCKDDLVLLQKYDGSPACVTKQTKTKLIERGWVTNTQSSINITSESYESKSETADAVMIGEKWSTGGILMYEKTVPVVDDVYLSHSVGYWQNIPRDVLEAEYEVHDDFYMDLGKLLVKNEMAYQMQTLGIENASDDFKVYPGAVDESLPPHIYYDAVINGTDGKTYRLQGAAHANRVNYYATEELRFYDTAQQFSFQDILTEPQLVTILPENGFEPKQEPKTVIVHLDDNKVAFFNNSPVTVRIQEHGSGKISEVDELGWVGPTIKPNQHGYVKFNNTGTHEWDARTPPANNNPGWWGSYGHGTVLVLSDDTYSLPAEDRIKMAGIILMDSEIPISGLGMGKSDGLRVYFGDAIYETLPNATQYYESRIKQIIPFDVNVIMER